MDYDKGFKDGRENGKNIMFHLTITIDGVNRFVTNPAHDTEDMSGMSNAKNWAAGAGRERRIQSLCG